MLFNSGIFAVFFILFFPLYLLTRRHVFARNALLIVSSYVFYGWWDPRFLILVAVSTSVDYIAALGAAGKTVAQADKLKSAAFLAAVTGASLCLPRRRICGSRHSSWSASAWAAIAVRLIERAPVDRRRRYWLSLSLVTNLGILGFFKYFNFFANLAARMHSPCSACSCTPSRSPSFCRWAFPSTRSRRSAAPWTPIGGSSIPDIRSSTTLAYHAFFPQLVAGPIERAAHLMPQFETVRPLTGRLFASGSLLFLWGLYQKMVIADNVAPFANAVFGHPAGQTRRGNSHCGPRIHSSDLLRLLRLLEHGTRPRPLPRLRPDGQFQSAVLRAYAFGVLAALAYQPLELAARLLVHLARRKSSRHADDVPQSHDHDAAWGPVAWRRLDVRCLGRVPWRHPGRISCAQGRCADRAHKYRFAARRARAFGLSGW